MDVDLNTKAVAYFVGIGTWWSSADGLWSEYKTMKGLAKTSQSLKVTKTAAKLPGAITAANAASGGGDLDLVLVTHGDEQGHVLRSKPRKDLIWGGADLAAKVKTAAGQQLRLVDRIVLWVCYAGSSPLGTAFRQSMNPDFRQIQIVGPTGAIGGLPYYCEHTRCTGSDEYDVIR